jgi:hypothetical protein
MKNKSKSFLGLQRVHTYSRASAVVCCQLMVAAMAASDSKQVTASGSNIVIIPPT